MSTSFWEVHAYKHGCCNYEVICNCNYVIFVRTKYDISDCSKFLSLFFKLTNKARLQDLLQHYEELYHGES